jgi:chaperone modulatory protein CbpM
MHDAPPLVGHVVEDEVEFSLEELSGACAVEQRVIIELMDEGVIETRSSTEVRFGGEALRRARLAMRLQRDLGLNTAGTALAIQLLERIEALERQVRSRF